MEFQKPKQKIWEAINFSIQWPCVTVCTVQLVRLMRTCFSIKFCTLVVDVQHRNVLIHGRVL